MSMAIRAKTLAANAILVLLSLTLQACSISNIVRTRQCGRDPESLRLLSAEGVLNTADDSCRFCLNSIRVVNGRTRLYVAWWKEGVSPKGFYISDDGGRTWSSQSSNPVKAVNVTTTRFGDLLEVGSSVDLDLEYKNQLRRCPPQFQRSFDGGRSFSDVRPVFEETVTPACGFTVISTGHTARARVYGRADLGKSTTVYVSDDYGDHFKPLRDHVAFVVESRADSSGLYGLGDSGLIRSTDGGANWEHPEGNEVLLKPVYVNTDTGRICTTRIDRSDKEYWSQNWLRQIETDPKDPRTFYVVCDKGLYRSCDGGDSFKLLPIALDKYHEIAKIAVDPLDGRNLYVALGSSLLYKSSDGGCSWSMISAP